MTLPESLNIDQIADLLTEKYCILREYIYVEDFYPWLRSKNVFTTCDEEEIQNTCPTTKTKAGALLDKIKLKGPIGFRAFTEVLEYSEYYGHVYKILFDSEPRKPSKEWTDTVKLPPMQRRTSSSLRVYKHLLNFASSLTDKAVNYKDKVTELERLLERLQLEWEEKEKVLGNTITDKEKGMDSLKLKLGEQEQEMTELKAENEKLLENISKLTTMKDSLKNEIQKIQERHRNQMSQTYPKQRPTSPSKKASMSEISCWFDNSETQTQSNSGEIKCLREKVVGMENQKSSESEALSDSHELKVLREKVDLLEKENKLINKDQENFEFENLQLRQHLCNCDAEFAKHFEQEQKLKIERNQALERAKVTQIREEQAQRSEKCWMKKYEDEKRRYEFSQSKLLGDVQDLKQELQKMHHCCGASVGDVICRRELGRVEEEID